MDIFHQINEENEIKTDNLPYPAEMTGATQIRYKQIAICNTLNSVKCEHVDSFVIHD